MGKPIIQNGVMSIPYDPNNPDDVINKKRHDVKGKGIKVASLSKPELEALVIAMAQKLGIELT